MRQGITRKEKKKDDGNVKEGISKAIGVANAELPDGEYKTCLMCELERGEVDSGRRRGEQ
jgi:hypothetical protein